MIDIKRYAMAGGALIIAATTGFVMQSGGADDATNAQASVAPELSGTADEPLEVTDITLTSAPSETAIEEKPVAPMQASMSSAIAVPSSAQPQPDTSIDVAALDDDSALPLDPAIPTAACEASMTAEPIAAAMVDLTLSATCFPNERVTIHHNGMMFTQATDANGDLSLVVPALSSNAVFIAAFANGEGALASASVDGLDFYDRKVVQSKAHGHLRINAFEFGANYRETGHVTAAAERGMEHAARGEGGFVTRLGDADTSDALVAEVYTFPSVTSQATGDIMVSVEAEVTTDNCGLRIEAQTLEVSEGGSLKVQDLTLPVPACDAVGDYVVLQNLLGDLKVARN